MCTTNNRLKQTTAIMTAATGGVMMKTFFKYFLFLVLSCSCFTAIGNPTSFLVGNNAGVGNGNFKGPSTAAQVTLDMHQQPII